MGMRSAVLLAITIALAGCLGGPLNPEGPIDRTPDELPTGALDADGQWDLAALGVENDPFLGNASAPVQVIAFDAPGCPNCKAYHGNAYQDIKADYIETGRIGYHYLQSTVGYRYDIDGGIAEECAFREGGSLVYEDMVDRVFANARDSSGLPAILDALAADHGLDADVLRTCYEDEETRDELDADFATARERCSPGCNPAFVVLGPDGFMKVLRGSAGPATAIEEALVGAA